MRRPIEVEPSLYRQLEGSDQSTQRATFSLFDCDDRQGHPLPREAQCAEACGDRVVQREQYAVLGVVRPGEGVPADQLIK